PTLEWRSRLGWILALASAAALGAWCVQATKSSVHLPDISRFTDHEEVLITAHVIRDGLLRGRGHFQRQSIDVETESILANGAETEVKAGIRLSIYPHGESGTDVAAVDHNDSFLQSGLYAYGQRLRFPAKLRELRNFQNPGAWDYRGYLLRQNVVATGSAPSDKIELLPGFTGSRWGRWRSRARKSVLANIRELWPEDTEILNAVLIGDRSHIGRDVNSDWQRTGLYHILVVSGMKVGMLAFAVFWTLRRLRASAWAATVITLMLTAGYAYLVEAGAPVMRAALMLAVFLVSRLLYRDQALLNSLGSAALVLFVIDPQAVFEASFQLTFLALLAIAGLGVPILERTSEPYGRGLRQLETVNLDPLLPPKVAQFRVELRMIAAGLARLLPFSIGFANRATYACLGALARFGLVIYETFVLSLVLQLAMTLPMAAYFHRATILGLPANVISVPLTGVLMPASALALAVAYFWLPLARIPARVASWALAGITWSARWFGRVHISDLRLPTPSAVNSLAIICAMVLAMLMLRRRTSLAVSGMASLFLAAVWLTTFPAALRVVPGVLEVTAIDVGQAESTLIVTPQGRAILVDAGGPLGPWEPEFDFGEDVVAPYLWSRGFRHLDAIVLTHAHSDHIGGMRGVVACFHPHELWLGVNPETQALDELKRLLKAEGASIISRTSPEQFDFGGANFRILAPPADWQTAAHPRNIDSLVFLVRYGATAALLTGDAEKKVEPQIEAQDPRADLLKVAHNGSRTSTTPEFLEAVQPSFAVIHVGAHNSFGHPRREVLERLSDAHVATFRTDMEGATTFILDGSSVSARPQSGDAGRVADFSTPAPLP
ncbi:MAG: ComEC/Rec2 family competence protein, partial [Terriglobales bacterium]